MKSSIRVISVVFAAITVWVLTRLLSTSPKVAFTVSACVLIFGLMSTTRMYLLKRRLLRRDVISQLLRPVLASLIVSLIVRVTHL